MRRRLGSAGLGYGQVFVLILGFLLASGLIFLFGFLVGQRRTEWLLAREERVVRKDMPAPPTPGGEEQTGVDLAFYESMKEKAYRRLQGTDGATPTAAVRGAVATPALPGAAPQTVTPARAAAKPTAAQQPKRTEGTAGTEWADAGWTVQVNATTNPQQARDLARMLKSKGYDAYTVQAPLRGQTWYRVRVGRFETRDKAHDMESRLKTREGMENAYVTPQ